MKAVSELLSHAFRWSKRQNKSDMLRFIEWCSVLQLSQTLILNLRPTEETTEAPRGNKLTGVTDLLPPGALKPTVNWDGFTWITMTWRTFQAAPGFSRSLASLRCFSLSASPRVSAAGMKSYVVSPTDVWVSSFKVGADWGPFAAAPLVYTKVAL